MVDTKFRRNTMRATLLPKENIARDMDSISPTIATSLKQQELAFHNFDSFQKTASGSRVPIIQTLAFQNYFASDYATVNVSGSRNLQDRMELRGPNGEHKTFEISEMYDGITGRVQTRGMSQKMQDTSEIKTIKEDTQDFLGRIPTGFRYLASFIEASHRLDDDVTEIQAIHTVFKSRNESDSEFHGLNILIYCGDNYLVTFNSEYLKRDSGSLGSKTTCRLTHRHATGIRTHSIPVSTFSKGDSNRLDELFLTTILEFMSKDTRLQTNIEFGNYHVKNIKELVEVL